MSTFKLPQSIAEPEPIQLDPNQFDPNCISVWYPIIENAVPTPKTQIVKLPVTLAQWIFENCGTGWPIHLETTPSACAIAELFEKAIQEVMTGATTRQHPHAMFMKSGLFSAKHRYKQACMLDLAGPIEATYRALAIAYDGLVSSVPPTYSALGVWAFREFLGSRPAFRAFGGTPIVREYRFFTKCGNVDGYQPYWPSHAIKEADCPESEWRRALDDISGPPPVEAIFYAQVVARMFPNDWSVDLFESVDGWYVIDMAVAKDSYRDPEGFVKL